jgi:sensor histidine kinase YesM
MKDFIPNSSKLGKLEFWAATTILVLAVFLLITAAVDNELSTIYTPNRSFFDEFNIPFNYYRNYLIPQLIRYFTYYLAFLILNFKVAPKLINRQNILKNTLLILLVFLMIGFVFGTTDTYLKNYLFTQYRTEQDTYNQLFQKSFLYAFWLLLVYGFYAVIKFTGIYLLSHSDTIQSRYKIISQDGIVAFILWMITMFLLVVGSAEGEVIVIWGIVIPYAILLYCYSFYKLIPSSLGKKKPFQSYMLKVLLVLIIFIIPVFLLVFLLINNGEAAFVISTVNVPFQFLVTAPLSWFLYKRRIQGKEEIYTLKKELGQSHASLDFLRSQINPHFLFNALNTIYGTAIHEKAERTCEAVERLGDMMRFMLQENTQEKISLCREIEYLNNYISLQKLRTDMNPIVKIDAWIEPQGNHVQISPMLLIPFVENAFKHGISLREPSHIRISLDTKDKILYFDVNNSKHFRQENDPEKNKSGIGLSNVKQRLQLLYPSKHELIIRETGKEFFVHLTLQLT